jgi:hypothetical protein
MHDSFTTSCAAPTQYLQLTLGVKALHGSTLLSFGRLEAKPNALLSCYSPNITLLLTVPTTALSSIKHNAFSEDAVLF